MAHSVSFSIDPPRNSHYFRLGDIVTGRIVLYKSLEPVNTSVDVIFQGNSAVTAARNDGDSSISLFTLLLNIATSETTPPGDAVSWPFAILITDSLWSAYYRLVNSYRKAGCLCTGRNSSRNLDDGILEPPPSFSHASDHFMEPFRINIRYTVTAVVKVPGKSLSLSKNIPIYPRASAPLLENGVLSNSVSRRSSNISGEELARKVSHTSSGVPEGFFVRIAQLFGPKRSGYTQPSLTLHLNPRFSAHEHLRLDIGLDQDDDESASLLAASKQQPKPSVLLRAVSVKLQAKTAYCVMGTPGYVEWHSVTDIIHSWEVPVYSVLTPTLAKEVELHPAPPCIATPSFTSLNISRSYALLVEARVQHLQRAFNVRFSINVELIGEVDADDRNLGRRRSSLGTEDTVSSMPGDLVEQLPKYEVARTSRFSCCLREMR